MRTQISKWGHSLAVRIPKGLAQEANLKEGSGVEVSVSRGKIILVPVAPKYTLEQLTSGITKKNRHDEESWGGPQGSEVW